MQPVEIFNDALNYHVDIGVWNSMIYIINNICIPILMHRPGWYQVHVSQQVPLPVLQPLSPRYRPFSSRWIRAPRSLNKFHLALISRNAIIRTLISPMWSALPSGGCTGRKRERDILGVVASKTTPSTG